MAHSHLMNLALAVRFGTNESLFLTNLCFWIEKNKANRVNYHDGYYWVYNTMEAWAELFPYFSKDQIRRLINKLKSSGVLLVGVYNRFQYDRTQWYSVSNEVIALYLGVFKKEKRGKDGQRNGVENKEEAPKTPEEKTGKEPVEPAGEEPSICPAGLMTWRKSRIHLPPGAHGCGESPTWKRRIHRIEVAKSPQRYHILNQIINQLLLLMKF